MAKRKRSKKRPQPKHKKQKKSQHDKRKRLQRRNPKRRKTKKAKAPLTGAMQTAVSVRQAAMDGRIAFRLAIIVAGMFLADDRRTASAWFVAGGVQEDWDRFYDCLTRIGRTFPEMKGQFTGAHPGVGQGAVHRPLERSCPVRFKGAWRFYATADAGTAVTLSTLEDEPAFPSVYFMGARASPGQDRSGHPALVADPSRLFEGRNM